MALRKNFSTEISDLETLKQIASALGLVQTRGQHRGEGSVRRLLEAIAKGEVRVLPAQEQQTTAEPLERVLETLAAEGLIGAANPDYAFPSFSPTDISGPLLSEQVMADRR
jgi:hypothetical protein